MDKLWQVISETNQVICAYMAIPLSRWHREQWQNALMIGGEVSWYDTAPQKHPPLRGDSGEIVEAILQSCGG